MYKMSKKSFIGRVVMIPFFLPVVMIEAILNKCDDWASSVHRLRIRMERFADRKFPLSGCKKTNV